LQEIETEPSLSIEFEELWETGKRRLAKYHHNIIDTNGASRRVLTSSWNRGDIANTLNLAFTFNLVSFSDSNKDNTLRIKLDWSRNKIYLHGGTDVVFGTNDRPMLTQKKGKDSRYVKAIRINPENEVVLAGAGAKGVSIGGTLKLGGGQNYVLPKSKNESIHFVNDKNPVNAVLLNSSAQEALKLKDPSGGQYTFLCHRSSFQIRDDAN